MNVKNSTTNIEPGYYAVATSNFTAYSKPIKEQSKAIILSVKTGDMFLIIEKDQEKYSRWPVKILTEEHGALYVSSMDAHHFVYVKCGGNLTGKSFCITGELAHPRTVYQKIIEMNGGTFKTTVSKNLDYLITNLSWASTKMMKAKELGIHAIREHEFLAMVG